MNNSDIFRYKTSVMTADEEVALANKINIAKYNLCSAILSDPDHIEEILTVYCSLASKMAKRKNEFRKSSFDFMITAAKRFNRRMIKAHEASMNRARRDTINAMVKYDPCMEIVIDLIKYIKYNHGLKDEYIKSINSSFNRYVRLRNRFIEKNIRLVILMSKRFLNYGIPQDDLVQEGTLGLQKAVGMFEPDKGFKFSTYAAWWIRASMARYCRNRSRVVRLPVNTQEKLERFNGAVRKLDILGEEFSISKISRMTDIKPKSIRKLQLLTLDKCYSTEFQVEDGLKLGDCLIDETSTISLVDTGLDMDIVMDVMPLLPKRQRDMINSRYGFDGGDGQTLQEIADKHGITRERVRQIIDDAINKMRLMLKLRMDRIYMGLPRIDGQE